MWKACFGEAASSNDCAESSNPVETPTSRFPLPHGPARRGVYAKPPLNQPSRGRRTRCLSPAASPLTTTALRTRTTTLATTPMLPAEAEGRLEVAAEAPAVTVAAAAETRGRAAAAEGILTVSTEAVL